MAEYNAKAGKPYQEANSSTYVPLKRGIMFVPRLSKIELSLESFTAMRYHGE